MSILPLCSAFARRDRYERRKCQDTLSPSSGEMLPRALQVTSAHLEA
jgi:hypothetical protein